MIDLKANKTEILPLVVSKLRRFLLYFLAVVSPLNADTGVSVLTLLAAMNVTSATIPTSTINVIALTLGSNPCTHFKPDCCSKIFEMDGSNGYDTAIPSIVPNPDIVKNCINKEHIICLFVYPMDFREPIFNISSSSELIILKRTTSKHTITIIAANTTSMTAIILAIIHLDKSTKSISIATIILDESFAIIDEFSRFNKLLKLFSTFETFPTLSKSVNIRFPCRFVSGNICDTF